MWTLESLNLESRVLEMMATGLHFRSDEEQNALEAPGPRTWIGKGPPWIYLVSDYRLWQIHLSQSRLFNSSILLNMKVENPWPFYSFK